MQYSQRRGARTLPHPLRQLPTVYRRVTLPTLHAYMATRAVFLGAATFIKSETSWPWLIRKPCFDWGLNILCVNWRRCLCSCWTELHRARFKAVVFAEASNHICQGFGFSQWSTLHKKMSCMHPNASCQRLPLVFWKYHHTSAWLSPGWLLLYWSYSQVLSSAITLSYIAKHCAHKRIPWSGGGFHAGVGHHQQLLAICLVAFPASLQI